jgi:tight adherence protein B
MSPLALFGLILLLSLGVMLVAIQPSKSEKAVRERLRTIGSPFLSTGQAPTDLLKQDALSDVEWLNDIMLRVRFFGALQRLLQQADSQRTVGTLFSGSILLAVSAGWLASIWVPAPALALLPALGAGLIPYAYLYYLRSRRFRRFEELLPDTIDLMTRALRAGHTITSGIEMVSQEVPEPVASEFRRVFEEQNFGLPIREAMLNLARRVPLPDLSFLVTAILVQKETGGNLAEILEKTTFVIRERFRLRGQLRVYTAQGRLTGWILVALPFFLFGVMTFLNPKYELVLINDPMGQKLVYTGLIMMVLGVLVIRKVIDIKV